MFLNTPSLAAAAERAEINELIVRKAVLEARIAVLRVLIAEQEAKSKTHFS